VELALADNVPLRLLSSFEEGPGSTVKLLPEAQRPRLAGITGRAETGRISLAGRGADAAALSEAVLLLAGAGIGVRDAGLGENVMTLTVNKEDHLKAMQILHGEMIL
jgi:aspartokinase